MFIELFIMQVVCLRCHALPRAEKRLLYMFTCGRTCKNTLKMVNYHVRFTHIRDTSIYITCVIVNRLVWCDEHPFPCNDPMPKEPSRSAKKYFCSCIKFCKGTPREVSKSSFLRHAKFEVRPATENLGAAVCISSIL